MSRNAALFTSQKKTLPFPLLLDEIQQYMSEKYRELTSNLDSKNGEQFRSYIQQYLTEKEYGVEGYDFDQLVEKLYDEMAGFSFLSQYIDMRVPGVEEVNINAWDDVEVHFSGGRVEPADGQFYSPLHATNVVKRILSKSGIILDGAHPCVRGHLNKNIRVTVNGPGVIDDDIGVQASIRFVNPQKLGKDAFLKNGLAIEEMLDFLVTLYRHGVSMCLAGPTGSGKTTLMGYILGAVANNKKNRLFTIEVGNREFDLVLRDKSKEHVLNSVMSTVTKESNDPKQVVTAQMLLEQALTFHPKYICMSEMKGSEAFETVEAALTGHADLSTVHADSCEDIYDRILTLCVQKSTNLSENKLMDLIIKAFPVVFYVDTMEDGVRRIVEIAEGESLGNGKYRVHTLYRYRVYQNKKNPASGKTEIKGRFEKVNPISEKLQAKLRRKGLDELTLEALIGGEAA